MHGQQGNGLKGDLDKNGHKFSKLRSEEEILLLPVTEK